MDKSQLLMTLLMRIIKKKLKSIARIGFELNKIHQSIPWFYIEDVTEAGDDDSKQTCTCPSIC